MKIEYLLPVLVSLACFSSFAQEGEGSKEDPAMKAQNPLANIISVPFQWNTDFGIGPHDRTGSVLNIQPIIPVNLPDDWVLINRAILPLPKMTPLFSQNSGSQTGLGDITMMNWFSPPTKGSFMYGLGPVTIWPTATDGLLGADKYSVGPSTVFVYQNPKFIAASVINAWWSVAGDSSAPDVATFYWQPIFNYFLPDKWYLTTAPVILADLKADSDDRWVIPLGGGIGKMFNWGKMPMDVTAQGYYYVEKPDGGPEWMFRLQVKLIFPQ